ncbi:hypothetical protein F5Y10DRAFT_287200 [Nemania abortiva]|nr:hypothetical protein F5Y10DRAFT_287200 [Nemania abortiva]
MLLIDPADRIRSGTTRLGEHKNDYILKPCPSKRPEQLVRVLRVKVDNKVRDLTLKDIRAQLTQRFTSRVDTHRQSLRVRERSTTMGEHDALPHAATTELADLPGRNREYMEPNGRPGAELGAVPMQFSACPPHETERSSIDDALPREETSTFMQNIDTIIRSSFSASDTSTEVHEAAFDITWQIQQCVRDELKGNPDLGPVLTVTGNSLHAWATLCHEYVRTTWKEVDCGERFLMDLEILLGKKFPTESQPISRLRGTLCPVDEEASGVSRLVFRGTVTEISILGQFLSWITASFRLPRSDQVACSSVEFRGAPRQQGTMPVFRISVQDLRDLDDVPGTCWKALFPRIIMACDFPVPTYPGTRGLRIPFEAMLGMAEIRYDVTLEDDDGNDAGVYFDGISYTLYPTAYIREQHVIQWHLETKRGRHDGERDYAIAPDTREAPKWERISSLETLKSATAILGYCSEATIERPKPEVAGGAVKLGINMMGSGMTGLPSARARKDLHTDTEAGKEANYTQMLDEAEGRSVILCDTELGKKRAWKGPKLSLILELFNIRARKKGIENIKYANPEPDGGKEAKAVLRNIGCARRVVVPKVLESESDKQIGDIVKGIYGSIQQCVKRKRGQRRGSTWGYASGAEDYRRLGLARLHRSVPNNKP